MCPDITNIQLHYECVHYGERCLKAHNRVEEFYHPEKYKSKFCQTYPNDMENCEYGELCAFAHSEDEITVDLLHKIEPRDPDFYIFYFKTAWCPWSQDHDKENCVYAHNWQDLRRKPSVYNYERDLCRNWHIDNFIRSYSDGCPNEYRCKHSHGWKEQQYHPRNYKINPCKQNSKCKKQHCPYYHSEEDRRYHINSNFKLLPKNRGGNFSQNNPHLNIYKEVFLSIMFSDKTRTVADQHSAIIDEQLRGRGGRNQRAIRTQTIYGCGPQSVPVIDPKILQQFRTDYLNGTLLVPTQLNQYSQPHEYPMEHQNVISGNSNSPHQNYGLNMGYQNQYHSPNMLSESPQQQFEGQQSEQKNSRQQQYVQNNEGMSPPVPVSISGPFDQTKLYSPQKQQIPYDKQYSPQPGTYNQPVPQPIPLAHYLQTAQAFPGPSGNMSSHPQPQHDLHFQMQMQQVLQQQQLQQLQEEWRRGLVAGAGGAAHQSYDYMSWLINERNLYEYQKGASLLTEHRQVSTILFENIFFDFDILFLVYFLTIYFLIMIIIFIIRIIRIRIRIKIRVSNGKIINQSKDNKFKSKITNDMIMLKQTLAKQMMI